MCRCDHWKKREKKEGEYANSTTTPRHKPSRYSAAVADADAQYIREIMAIESEEQGEMLFVDIRETMSMKEEEIDIRIEEKREKRRTHRGKIKLKKKTWEEDICVRGIDGRGPIGRTVVAKLPCGPDENDGALGGKFYTGAYCDMLSMGGGSPSNATTQLGATFW